MPPVSGGFGFSKMSGDRQSTYHQVATVKHVWHSIAMLKRSSKKSPADTNKLLYEAVREPIGEDREPESGKNPAAVALGRKGGLKGGKARAAKLSDERKKEIARKAANARWGKKDDK